MIYCFISACLPCPACPACLCLFFLFFSFVERKGCIGCFFLVRVHARVRVRARARARAFSNIQCLLTLHPIRCRGKNPPPDPAIILPSLPILAQHMTPDTDDEIMQDAGWALSYISDGSNDKLTSVVRAGLMPVLNTLLVQKGMPLGATLNPVLMPCVRVVGNIASGDETHVDALIDAGLLVTLKAMLGSCLDDGTYSGKRITLIKEICWGISNITAGTQLQIQAVIDANLIALLVDRALDKRNWSTQKEAAIAIANAVAGSGAASSALQTLASSGCVRALCSFAATCYVDAAGWHDAQLFDTIFQGVVTLLDPGTAILTESGTSIAARPPSPPLPPPPPPPLSLAPPPHLLAEVREFLDLPALLKAFDSNPRQIAPVIVHLTRNMDEYTDIRVDSNFFYSVSGKIVAVVNDFRHDVRTVELWLFCLCIFWCVLRFFVLNATVPFIHVFFPLSFLFFFFSRSFLVFEGNCRLACVQNSHQLHRRSEHYPKEFRHFNAGCHHGPCHGGCIAIVSVCARLFNQRVG